MEDIDKERLSARFSLIKRLNTTVGICETLRLTYDLIADLPDKDLKDKITEKLVDAMVMAKKINERLSYYHKKYHDNTGHAGQNLKGQTGVKARIIMRRARTV
jgi:hypothetical protein